MKNSVKSFLVFNLKDHFWDYSYQDDCLYSTYSLGKEEKHWFEVFFDEYFDFIEANYDAFVDYEEKDYNEAFHINFDFDFDYLHQNFIRENELRNELVLVAKTILQEPTIYPILNRYEISYLDQYNKKTNILYTNLCEVKYEKEGKETIMFSNMLEKLKKITNIDVKYTRKNTALLSYEGYAFDLEKMQQEVFKIMNEEKMNENKVIMAEPMLQEKSLRYDKIKKWVENFREFYQLKDEPKKKKR